MKTYSKKAKRFYDSKPWKSCREYYIGKRINIDGGMCEHCKERLGYIVDHKEELNDSNIDDPNISLNHDKLQYLCLECSNRKTFTKDDDNRGVRFDDEGNPEFFDTR
ncbi:HNH endonuclease [Helcococcus kunzii]|uniref:HNH endonuclease n=1 Tax=Helcococcus kunzii TaxID=40091 RepID=UPI001BAFAC45|nr:HNH endonuclease [Helcococcus kunzii]QUY64284.1 HNH endonuclease [Helcococcus kunzii]